MVDNIDAYEIKFYKEIKKKSIHFISVITKFY